MPDVALDFSWEHPDVDELVAHGVKNIMFYSRISTPPRAYLMEAVAKGVGVCPIFETAATRPWLGLGAGIDDGVAAHGDLNRIGVPDGVRLYVNMSDTPNVRGHEGDIAAYARGFASTFPEKWRLGAYGPLVALRAAQAGSPRYDGLWGVETWHPDSTGSPTRNFALWSGEPGVLLVQMANVPPPIDGTDTNWQVHADLGAWGQPAPPPDKKEDDDVYFYIQKESDAGLGIWATDSIYKRHVNPDEWQFANDLAAFAGKPAPLPSEISDQWWDSLPIAGSASVDVTSLAQLLAGALPPVEVGTALTQAQIAEALRSVLHNA